MLENECTVNKFDELSEAATCEILGENLVFTIAIGKNGEIVVLYPFGTSNPIGDFKICKEQKTALRTDDNRAPLKIDIAIPSPTDYMDTCNPNDPINICNLQLMYAKWPPRQGTGGK
jgi:hypothetical protein